MLNHQDENLHFISRNSLEIDFNKRSIKRSIASNNFLGYACKSNGDLKTNIRGGFGVISDWPHLHHIAVKLGLRLTREHPENQNLMECGKALTSFECKHSNITKVSAISQRMRTEITDKQVYELNHAKELPMQGKPT